MYRLVQSFSLAATVIAASIIPGFSWADSSAKPVEFAAAMTPPSPFRLRIAKAQGKKVRVYPTQRLKGFLYTGGTNGGGVIIAPGCLGVKDFHHTWARRLTEWGYAALIVDSAGSRGMSSNCPGENLKGYREADLGNRVYDIYGAHDYLVDQVGADPKRIALMGWGYNDTLMAVIETGIPTRYPPRALRFNITPRPLQKRANGSEVS